MTIKSVEFVFENCETVNVPIEYVENFSLGDVCKTITFSGGSTKESESVTRYYFVISKSFKDSGCETYFGDNGYERLKKHMDICWIYIHNQDGSQEEYGVLWKDEDMYTNHGQSFEEFDDSLLIEVK